jgi:peptide/nickel transport system substrate-binding protein
MHTVRRLSSVRTAFALGLLLVVPAVPRAAQPEARAAEKIVRIGVSGQLNSLNPLVASQAIESYIDCAIFSGLVVLDDRGDVSPDLARRVPTTRNGGVSLDGKTITYVLRPGVRWQDGAPLTARDVVFTFERIRDPRTGSPSESTYQDVASVQARDAQTIVVRLKRPAADIVSEIFVNGQNGSIVPEHVLNGVAVIQHSAFSDHPVGSGPYVVEDWSRDSRLRLRANPRYFRGKPAVDELRIDFVPDVNTKALQLRAGEFDFVPTVPEAVVAWLRTTRSFRIADLPSYTVLFLQFRGGAPPFDDPRVRRALAIDTDRYALAHKAYLGFASPAAELVPPWSRFATVRTAQHADPAVAARLLEAAGWYRGADGVRERAGRRFTATLTTVAGTRTAASAAVQLIAQWRALGLDVSIRAVAANQLFAPDGDFATGHFAFALTGVGFGTTPDRSSLLATRSIPPAGDNYSRYSNAEVDKAIEVANSQLDPAARRRAFAEIAKAVAADAPYVPLVWFHSIKAISTRLENVKPEPVDSDLWNVYEWKLR